MNINTLLKARPRNSSHGAPMGAMDRVEKEANETGPLHVQRVRLVDGDYGPDGTYWGSSALGDIYAAFSPCLAVLLYTRAKSRADAVRQFLTVSGVAEDSLTTFGEHTLLRAGAPHHIGPISTALDQAS